MVFWSNFDHRGNVVAIIIILVIQLNRHDPFARDEIDIRRERRKYKTFFFYWTSHAVPELKMKIYKRREECTIGTSGRLK